MEMHRQQKDGNPRHEGVGKLRILIGTAVALAMLLVAVPAIAHNYAGYGTSYSAPSGCTSGRLCVYSGTAFSGSFAQFNGSNTDWDCCSSARNNDESAYNNGNSGRTVKVYANQSYGGKLVYCLRLGHGLKWPYLIGSGHANNGESNQWQWNGC